MESKFTKGKWELKLNNNWPFGYDIENEQGEKVYFGVCHYSTEDKNINDCLKRDFKQNSESLANAQLIESAPEMFEELKETITDLKILRNQIYFESKSNHLFQGMPELMDKWIARKEQLLIKITSND